MVKVVKRYTDKTTRGEWLEDRTKGIGGSDASIVLGINKYKTPFELFLEKTGQVIPEEIDNEQIYWGNTLENVVAKEFERRTGKKVRRRNQLLQHDEHDFMKANLDRVIVGENAFLECKTASAYLYKEWEGDEIPAPYLIQVNHYLAVTGYEKGYICVLLGGNKFVWKEIERDEELINMIIEAEKHFWEHNVLGMNPPALDGSSAAEKYIKERFKDVEPGKVIDLKAEHKTNLDNYFQLKEEAKDLETRIKEIENKIQFDLADAETGFIGSYRVNWKQFSRKGGVDSKKLAKDFPDVYEKVIKPDTSYRKFEVKVDK